jgi:hypothetical protein
MDITGYRLLFAYHNKIQTLVTAAAIIETEIKIGASARNGDDKIKIPKRVPDNLVLVIPGVPEEDKM